MLKALLKKQLLELLSFYFFDRKKGKLRSAAGIAGFAVLFAFVFASVALSFAGISALLCGGLLALDMGWLYFAIMGMIAILLGVICGVLSAYWGLYLAKDNELLLSMPIPPRYILFVRLIGIYGMGLLFESLVLVPAVIIYWTEAGISLTAVLFPLLVILLVSFLILSLTCVFGWLIALFAARFRNKSFLTVLFALVLIGLYYVVYFRINTLMQSIVTNAEKIGNTVKTVLFPFYHMGRAFCGDPLSLLIFALIAAALTVLVIWVLSASFLHIATMNRGGKKAVYREKTEKAGNADSALLYKELRHFSQSSVYMLNIGLGVVILPAAVIALFIRRDMIGAVQEILTQMFPKTQNVLPVLVAAAVSAVSSMNLVTAPSVSLEGKTLWILQSMPVDMRRVLRAKLRTHMVIALPMTALCTPVMCLLFGFGIAETVTAELFCVLFVCFTAVLGLTMNLIKPNLVWTNETMPIKQGASVGFTMLGSFACVLLSGGGYFLLSGVMGPWLYLLAVSVVLAVVSVLLYRWIMTRGAEILTCLQ